MSLLLGGNVIEKEGEKAMGGTLQVIFSGNINCIDAVASDLDAYNDKTVNLRLYLVLINLY